MDDPLFSLAQLRWRGDIAFGLSVRPFSRHTLGGVVLCALLLQSDKAVDFKTYAD